MGQTLENGVYLPSEGERNCYAGLKTNWEILDQKVADVTALQQAVAGALHREIVESLPTTDIDPNTIYMILSGTSATENVYNEFMYVNNAWELIGTSATDLTNYYTKGDVDGLLLLKANASDLTSHTGDTTIHVTTADKSKWNNGVSQSYVLRYSSASVTDNSTIAYSTLDNTDNVKTGDKVIDVDGKIFSVVSVDTANSTVTVGSALIDLALDANVVHTSGNETVGGVKTFSNDITLQGTTTPIIKTISNIVQDTSAYNGSVSWVIRDKDDLNNILESALYKYSTKSIDWQLKLTGIDNGVSNTKGIRFTLAPVNNVANFIPMGNNNISLGNSSTKWKSVYATNYYYGADAVEFSTKFVTTDTAQTVSGNKTFSDNLTIYNSDDTQTPKGLSIRNAQWGMGESGGTTVSNINFLDKNSSIPASVMASKGLYGQSFLRFSVRTKDSQNTIYSEEIYYDIDTSGNVEFRSWHDNIISLGTSAYKWKDVQTYKVNNLEPSSLSLPSDRSARIDISSYITNLGNGDNNSYTVPANGYIWLHFTSINSALCYSQTPGGLTNYAQTFVRYSGDGQLYAFFPVRKDDYFIVQVYTSSTAVVQNAYFIPCQGNV